MSVLSNAGQMTMKWPPKYGQIYDHKGAVSTTNWHLPRALPMTEEQRHLPHASTEIESHAAIAIDLQQSWGSSGWSEALCAPRNLVVQVFKQLDIFQFSSVQSLSRVQLCDPMNHNTPGHPVYHQLPEFTQRLHFHFSLSCIGEGNSNPLQCSCLENPRDGGAWWAAVYGVAQSRTQLKWLGGSSNASGWWCHPAISSSVVPFSSCPQSLPASGSFSMSQLFPWGSQSIGVSALASVLPVNTQDWSPLGWPVGSPFGPRDSQESSPTPQFKSINSLALSFLHSPTLTSIHAYWKNHSLD